MRQLLLALTVAFAAAPALADWDPAAFSKEETLEFRTTAPGESEHWSTVWLVVIDGQVYMRLGSRAAGRVESNTTKPTLAIRIGGQTFEKVTAEPAPDMAEAVAKAMHEKYWSDVFIQYFDHPLTLRLVPAP
ncbi:MAG: hypothetical protein SF182_07815 [Deltaproteobacteria bacterium]|nr:hypothetical protein [Deltaproteobacteria bacterium]